MLTTQTCADALIHTPHRDHQRSTLQRVSPHETNLDTTARPAALPWHWGLWALFGLAVLQYGLFRQHALREVVWAYPRNSDQAVYLGRSYQIHEFVLRHGLQAGIKHALNERTATGLLFPLQAALSYLVMGPDRLSALTLNFYWFIALQTAFAATLYWLSQKWSVAFLGVGLLLAAMTSYSPVGGLTDYRIDFTAFCLFGILLSTVIRSQMFLNARWSAVVGSVAGVLVLFRFLTAVYLAGIFGLVFAAVVWQIWRGRNEITRNLARRRLRGMMLAGLIVGLITGPVLWRCRQAIYGYYVVGHLTGDEKHIRAAQMNVVTLADSLTYYPRSVARHHLGLNVISMSAVAVFAALLYFGFAKWRSRASDDPGTPTPKFSGLTWGFAAATVVIPLFVLTSDVSKSPVVGNIVVPGVLWLILLAYLTAMRNGAGIVANWTGRILAFLAVLVGSTTQAAELSRRTFMSQKRSEIESLLSMYDRLGEYARESGLSALHLFQFSCSDHLNHDVANVLQYERRRHWFNFARANGSPGIFEMPAEEILQSLRSSEIVLFEEKNLGKIFYPSDKVIQSLRPQIQAYCVAQMRELGTYLILGRNVIVYVRPTLKLTGSTADQWISSSGIDLRGFGKDVSGCRSIEFDCERNSYLKNNPAIAVELRIPGQPPEPLTGEVTPGDDKWRVRIDWKSRELPKETPISIHVQFDEFFVPAAVNGQSSDDRELVARLSAPTLITLVQEEKRR